jgi:alpha-L-arabinofuranosidase
MSWSLAVSALVVAGTLFPSSIAQTPTATVSIQLDKPLHSVSPRLYGLMTEEINYSYDGGLYAEMVRNRSFQEHGWAGVAHWNLVHTGNAQLTMTVDTAEGPSEALPRSLRLDVTQAYPDNQAGASNEGYWGMVVHPDTTYKGSFYAKVNSTDAGPLRVSLVNDTTGATLAFATSDQLTTGWKRYEFTLHTTDVPASSENHIQLTLEHPGTVWLSLVSLFPPTYRNRDNGNRIDLMEKLAAMHPQFLRLPGGNYLEGDTVEERFDWKATIGPLVDRPTHRGPWKYESSDGLGLLEFLEWTEDLKIEPVLAVYAGYSLQGAYVSQGPSLRPYVDDALDEIEFVSGDAATTKWGAIRAKLGHPAPFPLSYVEIGNEDSFDRSGSYEGRYQQFYKVIKARYPSLQLIATEPLKQMKPDVVDDHYYKSADEFFNFVTRYDDVDRNGPKIFIGEWATREGSPTTNFGAALGDAAWMTAMERNSDLIVMAAYAPLLVNVNPGGMQWESDLIGYDALNSYGSPSYYAQSLFAEYLGTEVPASTLSAAPARFFYSVTHDPGKGLVYLKLVNANSLPQQLQINLRGAGKIIGSVTLVTLGGTNPAETNTISAPIRILPVKTSLQGIKSSFRHIVPGYAIEVLAIPIR